MSNQTTTTKHPAETLFKWSKDRLSFAKAVHQAIDSVALRCFGKGLTQTQSPVESVPSSLGVLDSMEFFNLALSLILDEDHAIQELSAAALWRLVEMWKEMDGITGIPHQNVFWHELDATVVKASSQYVQQRTHFLGQSALCACDDRNHPLMRSLGVTRQLVPCLWDDVESVRNVASNLMGVLEGTTSITGDASSQLSQISNPVQPGFIKFQQERAALLLTQQHKLVTYLQAERRAHQGKACIPVVNAPTISPRRPSMDANAFVGVTKTWSTESLSQVDLLTPWAPITRGNSCQPSRRPSWENDFSPSLAEFGFHLEPSPARVVKPLLETISIQIVELTSSFSDTESEDEVGADEAGALPPLPPKSRNRPGRIVTDGLTNIHGPRSAASSSSNWSHSPVTSSDWSPASAASTSSLGSLVGGMRNWQVESPSKSGPIRMRKECSECATHHTTEWKKLKGETYVYIFMDS
jgi:hypothetical protein